MDLRRLGPHDDLMPFLVEAMNWRGGRECDAQSILTTPSVAHYISGWMRSGDDGVIAEIAGQAAGCAWWRQFDASDPSYGYVADDVPELGIAVLPGYRGKGIGRAVLTGLLELAAGEGHEALSLSVEDRNHGALRLYESLGFEDVGRSGGSSVMLRRR